MDDPKDILTLLGLNRENISSFDISTDGKNTIIRIEIVDNRPYCPHCLSRDTKIKGYYIRHINDSIIKHQNITVDVRQRRYVCSKCGKTFTQDLDFVRKGDKITYAAKQSILDDLKERRTIASIAKEHNVSSTTVINIFDKVIFNEMRVQFPLALCIDEFHFVNRKSLGKYPAVISNYMTGDIIDIIKSRKKEYLFEYFNKVLPRERYKVKYFISDMNESYRTVKKAFFRDAYHVIDMFHITKLFTEAIQKIRVKIMKTNEFNRKEYRFLKKNWKLFLMHQDDLKKRKVVNKKTGEVYDLALKVNQVLRHYPDLNSAYQLYEDFHYKTRKLLSWKESENLVDFIAQNCKKSQLIEINQIGQSFTNWRYELISTFSQSCFSLRLSNAVAEANNNNIQTLIDSAYGLLNFDRMRKRVLYVNANKKTEEH